MQNVVYRIDPPVRPNSVLLRVVKSFNKTSIFQQPSQGNGYETVILLDDDKPPGSHQYEFFLIWP